MGAMEAIQAGLGIFDGFSDKRSAKKAAKQQRKIAEQEFKFNKKTLIDNYINNSMVDFSETAKAMSSLTQQYINTRTQATMLTNSYFNGGASFNSNRSDTMSSVNLDFNTKIFEYNNLKLYNEETLKKQFSVDLTNLTAQRNNTMYNISYNLYNAKRAANAKIRDSAIKLGGEIYNMANGEGTGKGGPGKTGGSDISFENIMGMLGG